MGSHHGEEELVAAAILSRADLGVDHYRLLRELCDAALKRYENQGLTGFFLYHRVELVGYLEGPAQAVHGLIEEVSSQETQELLHRVNLGGLATRRCEGWALRILEGHRTVEIGLDSPLRTAIRMRRARGGEADRIAHILRIVEKIVTTWEIADDPGSECP